MCAEFHDSETMGNDAFTPITVSRTLDTPKGYEIFTTTRKMAIEAPLPAMGSLLADANFIGGFTGHYVLDVTSSPMPMGNQKSVSVTHGIVPQGSFVEYETVPYLFPSIYPHNTPPGGTAFFPGGSLERSREALGEVTYEYALAPTAWLDDAATWDYADLSTGPFCVQSFIAAAASECFEKDVGSSGRVSDYLNPYYIGRDTINDEIIIRDPGILFFTIYPSVPSAATYAQWVAEKTKIMTSRTVHRWYCFYMRRTVKVKAQ